MDLATLLEGQTSSFSGNRNVWKIMSDIASGIQFIHDQGFIITDLKPHHGRTPED